MIIALNIFLYYFLDASYHSIISCLLTGFFHYNGNLDLILIQPLCYYLIDLNKCILDNHKTFIVHHILTITALIYTLNLNKHIVLTNIYLINAFILLELTSILVNIYTLHKCIFTYHLLFIPYFAIRILYVPFILIFNFNYNQAFELIPIHVSFSIITFASYFWFYKLIKQFHKYSSLYFTIISLKEEDYLSIKEQ